MGYVWKKNTKGLKACSKVVEIKFMEKKLYSLLFEEILYSKTSFVTETINNKYALQKNMITMIGLL